MQLPISKVLKRPRGWLIKLFITFLLCLIDGHRSCTPLEGRGISARRRSSAHHFGRTSREPGWVDEESQLIEREKGRLRSWRKRRSLGENQQSRAC